VEKLTKLVLSRFNQLGLTTRDNKKQNMIIQMGESLGLHVNSTEVEDMGIYMTHKDESINDVPEIIFVSHFDLVYPFEKGFKEHRVFDLFENGDISGALDNTITNAALLEAVSQNGGLPKGVALFFSNGEESGMWGVNNFFHNSREIETFDRIKNETFFINLDVTNDQYEQNISIEYDCKIVLKKELDLLNSNELRLGVQYVRYADDMSVILGKGMQGYSACLPTIGNCHSYKSTTTIDKIQEYTLFLTSRMNKGNFM